MKINLGAARSNVEPGQEFLIELMSTIVLYFALWSSVKLAEKIEEWRRSKKTPFDRIGDNADICEKYTETIELMVDDIPSPNKESKEVIVRHVISLDNVRTKLEGVSNIVRGVSTLKGDVGDDKKILGIVKSNAKLLSSTDSKVVFIGDDLSIDFRDLPEDDVDVTWPKDKWYTSKDVYLTEFKRRTREITTGLRKMQSSVKRILSLKTDGAERDELSARAEYVRFAEHVSSASVNLLGIISDNMERLSDIDV